MNSPYILDTNILVHYVRQDRTWTHIQSRYAIFEADPTPVISVVTIGEIRSLATRLNWQADRRSHMNFIVDHVVRITIAADEIYDAYATIETFSLSNGKSMGKNDLWIAATANYLGAHLLTTDKDFLHLSPNFITVDWIDPTPPPTVP